MSRHKDQLQGTIDLLVLRTLVAGGTMHGYAISERIQDISREILRVEEGSLYPALHRMEESGWIKSSWGNPTTTGGRGTTRLPPRGAGSWPTPRWRGPGWSAPWRAC